MSSHRACRGAVLVAAVLLASTGVSLPSVVFPPLIAASCPQFPAIDGPGVLCENFDTDRNGIPNIQFTRLPIGQSATDPLLVLGDPGDDILGFTMDSRPIANRGIGGTLCTDSIPYNQNTCTSPVAEENDWHLHTAVAAENSDPTMNAGYQPTPGAPDYAPGGGKAHGGSRSMHWGRHTIVFSGTLGDTTRFRQVSAFVLETPVNLGPSSTMEFWHMMQVPDDDSFGFTIPGTTFSGGQIQISLLGADGLYERWRPLEAAFNGSNSLLQGQITICSFDPGDDQFRTADETTCAGHGVWSDIGDIIGTDAACQTDTDFNDSVNKDCGEIRSCTGNAGGAPWPAPGGEDCTENGSVGPGVWARSAFDLSPFAGRQARIRWIGMMGGGWSFGISRSFLEGYNPGAYNYDEIDDGWWIDDIVLTDLRESPIACDTDDDADGFTLCGGDCNDRAAGAWDAPGEARDVTFTDANHLGWMPPAAPAGATFSYDTIRTPDPSDLLGAATCLETDDGADTTAEDLEIPAAGTAFYYLVRARNQCPLPLGSGPAGANSAGAPRLFVRLCP